MNKEETKQPKNLYIVQCYRESEPDNRWPIGYFLGERAAERYCFEQTELEKQFPRYVTYTVKTVLLMDF